MQHFDHHHCIESIRGIVHFFLVHGNPIRETGLLHLGAGFGQALVIDIDPRQARTGKCLRGLQQEIAGTTADFENCAACGQSPGKGSKAGKDFFRSDYLQALCRFGDRLVEMIAAALKGFRLAGFEGFTAAQEVIRRHFGSQSNVTAKITRMRGRGENRLEMRRQTISALRIGVENFQPVRRLAPDLDIRRVKPELARQFRAAESCRLRQRPKQPQVHSKVDQVNGIESAPPFKNTRDLRIGSDLSGGCGHGLCSWSDGLIDKVYWCALQINEPS